MIVDYGARERPIAKGKAAMRGLGLSAGLAAAVAVSCAVHVSDAGAATEAVVYAFQGGSDGAWPNEPINVNGTLYGTTAAGGVGCTGSAYAIPGCGTVYKLTLGGTETVLYRFQGGSDGRAPAQLIDVDGTLYGTTGFGGGAYGAGTVFKITPDGTKTTLYSFQSSKDGYNTTGLVHMGSALYGTNYEGGANGWGTVFKVTLLGRGTVLHTFKGQGDGSYPNSLIAVRGTLYGTTLGGGISGVFGPGTVFNITPSGVETAAYSFTGGSDGSSVEGGLLNVGGTLYGITWYGGLVGGVYHHYTRGSIYKLAPDGSKSIVFSFRGGKYGQNPGSGVTDIHGRLFGTTVEGGAFGSGVVYEIFPNGAERVLYDFPSGDCCNVMNLVNINGTLYGRMGYGGGPSCSFSSGCGVIFSITP
jgi:uncharacterized repeat protein (TIGR03803 family)